MMFPINKLSMYSILIHALMFITSSKSFTISNISSYCSSLTKKCATISSSTTTDTCRGVTFGKRYHHDNQRCLSSSQLFMSSSSSQDDNEKRKMNNENFLEEASKLGYDKVKSMSIEERTRRAMLAEAAEDRVVMLSDELESLLGDDGMPLKVEDREEVVILANEIKASREQYRKLVNGENCASLNLFASTSSQSLGGKSSSSSDDTTDLQ